MVSKRTWGPSGKKRCRHTARQRGLTNLDGRQRSRQGVTDDTTTNHQQERWRGDNVGVCCRVGDGGGKGKGVVASALAAEAAVVAATAVGHHLVVVIDGNGKDVITAASINCLCS